MKKVLFIVGFACLLYSVSLGQNVSMSVGKENKVDAEKLEFSVLGFVGSTLYAIYNQPSGTEYTICAFDKNNQYELEKELVIDIKSIDGVEGEVPRMNYVRVIGNKLLIVVSLISNESRYYYGATVDIKVLSEIDWVQLLSVKLEQEPNTYYIGPNKYDNDNFSYVNFFDGDSVLVVHHQNETVKYYDIDFDEIEMDEEEDQEDIDFEEGTNKVSIASNYGKNRIVTVYLISPHKEYNHKPSEQYLYYSVESSSRLIRYNYGKLFDIPVGKYFKEIHCSTIDSNEFIVYGVYNDLQGIFLLKYDIKESKVLGYGFEDFEEAFKKTLKKSDMYKHFGISPLADMPSNVIRNDNGGYFLINSENKTLSSSSASIISKGKEKYEYQFGDKLIICMDVSGKILSNNVLYRSLKKTADYVCWNKSNPYEVEIRVEKNNQIILLCFDDISNYKDGVYNGKNKGGELKDNYCLAMTSVSSSGEYVRKPVTGSIVKETGVDLVIGAYKEVTNNEYAWLGFKDGIIKIITLKID